MFFVFELIETLVVSKFDFGLVLDIADIFLLTERPLKELIIKVHKFTMKKQLKLFYLPIATLEDFQRLFLNKF